jgi:serralysin
LGNDTYYVDVARYGAVNDLVEEDANSGSDVVYVIGNSAITFILPVNVENVTNQTGLALQINGNDMNNLIIGDIGVDSVNGLDGNDTVSTGDGNDSVNGGNGNDSLIAGAGNDSINGGTGVDTMVGGSGDDFYYVDQTGDVVVEATGGGVDKVLVTSSSYTLPGEVENMTVSYVGGSYVVGNSTNNSMSGYQGNDTLYGQDGNDTISGDNGIAASGNDNLFGGNGNDNIKGGYSDDTLNGGSGNDSMDGGSENDTYYVDSVSDLVVDSQGIDTIYTTLSSFTLGSTVENLTHNLNTTFAGTGNDSANIIMGNNFADTLNGGLGNDTLTGGGSGDFFLFKTALGATNIDTITDFQHGNDKFELENTGTGLFNALTTGALASTAFKLVGAALDADDRIVHDQATGKVYYDADGSGAGAQVQFAQVTSGLALTFADFLVI